MKFYNYFIDNFTIIIGAAIGMLLLILFFRNVALKIGLVDVPNARKIHSNPVPMVGGLALFIMSTLMLPVVSAVNLFSFYLVLASGLVVVIGLLDDLYQLSAFWRFLIQILASLIVIYFSQVQLHSFGFLLNSSWDLYLGVFAIPVTIFGVVGVINALNMADGVDGLAAMTFSLPVFVLIGLSSLSAFNLWLFMLLICVFVFVFFNKTSKYKVFLGDNGSLLLGFILAWLLVYCSQGESASIKPVSALYLVALPVYDTIFVMLRRLFKGRSPFKPDKTHLHHLFLAQQLSQTQVLMVMLLCQSVFIFLGVIFLKLNLAEHLQFYIFVGISALYYQIVKKVWSRINLKE